MPHESRRFAYPLALALLLVLAAACAPTAQPTTAGGASAEAQNTFVGVGLALNPATADGKGARIVDVLPDSPAEKASVPVGVVIVAVDGQEVENETTAAIVELLRGPLGTKVTLTTRADGAKGTETFELERVRLALP